MQPAQTCHPPPTLAIAHACLVRAALDAAFLQTWLGVDSDQVQVLQQQGAALVAQRRGLMQESASNASLGEALLPGAYPVGFTSVFAATLPGKDAVTPKESRDYAARVRQEASNLGGVSVQVYITGVTPLGSFGLRLRTLVIWPTSNPTARRLNNLAAEKFAFFIRTFPGRTAPWLRTLFPGATVRWINR